MPTTKEIAKAGAWVEKNAARIAKFLRGGSFKPPRKKYRSFSIEMNDFGVHGSQEINLKVYDARVGHYGAKEVTDEAFTISFEGIEQALKRRGEK